MHKARMIFIEGKHGHVSIVRNSFLDAPVEIGEFDITFRLRGRVTQVSPDGTFLFDTNQFTAVEMEKPFKLRSMNQNRTLRGIEYFIGYVLDAGPPEKDTLAIIHEGLLEEYAPKEISVFSGELIPKRTSQMNTKEMSMLIDKALNHLATMDIPHSVMEAIGLDMKTLWEKWYLWKNSEESDLYITEDMTWENYKKIQPVCEFTFVAPGQGIKLDQMHIVSRGAEHSAINEPWNWIRGRREIHQEQHQYGWEYVLRKYPHVKPKVERARKMAGKKGLIGD